MNQEEIDQMKKDSDRIFTAISTGSFKNYKEAEQAIVAFYVTDMSFSRAGISDAMKRLEKYYKEPSFDDKVQILKDKVQELNPDIFQVTGWDNFCRVFILPESFSSEFCPRGGIPVMMNMVDWFYPVQDVGQPAVSKEIWLEKFGDFDGMEKAVTMRELQESLIPFLQQKMYIIKDRKYLVMCDFGATFTFEGKPPVKENEHHGRFA